MLASSQRRRDGTLPRACYPALQPPSGKPPHSARPQVFNARIFASLSLKAHIILLLKHIACFLSHSKLADVVKLDSVRYSPCALAPSRAGTSRGAQGFFWGSGVQQPIGPDASRSCDFAREGGMFNGGAFFILSAFFFSWDIDDLRH